MTVKELIELLETYPPDLEIVYQLFSERDLLTPDMIEVIYACHPRPDGWVQNQRPDMPRKEYLQFPGN